MVVEEEKKREGERPTHRRMRPAAVFNWEEGWDCFFGRGTTINSWAAKYYHPALFWPSPLSLLYSFPAQPSLS